MVVDRVRRSGRSVLLAVMGLALVAGFSAAAVGRSIPSVTNSAPPSISGTPQVGLTLTAAPGTWSPAGVTFTYRWFSGTTPKKVTVLAGATGATYVVRAADVGRRLQVEVTGTKSGYSSAVKRSVLTATVVAAGTMTAATPTISGTPQVGATLTANPGTWSPDGVALTYQWLLDGGEITGATGTTYEPVAADVGHAVSVRVTGTKPGLTSTSATSASTAAVVEGALTSTPTPTIVGTADVGDTLTAVPGDWDAGVTLSYQWSRDGTAISGENTPTHVAVAEDDNTTLTVTVTGARPGYVSVSRTSEGLLVVQARESRAKVARALQAYHAALAGAGTDPVDMFVGPSDSLAEGYGATSVGRRWISILRDDIRRSFQPTGVVGGLGYADLWNGGSFSDYPVKTTIPVQDWWHGLGNQALSFATSSQTATITETFTAMDILYVGSTDGSTGVFHYSVDGGPTVAVDTGHETVAGGGRVTSINGLTPGVHTVRIMGPVIGVVPIVEGVMIYNGDTANGIRLWEGARNGFRAEQFAGAFSGWADSTRNIHPDLVVLALGSNDYAKGLPAATTKTNLLKIIATLRAKTGANPSIVLMPYYDRPTSSTTETWADYVDMYYSIAAADPDICVFDLTPLFGPWTGDDRGGLTISADLVHPSDSGHALIGHSMADFLAP